MLHMPGGSDTALHRLRASSALLEPPDLLISGVRVLNVFSGQTAPRDVGVTSGRIAWLALPGEVPRRIRNTEQLDLSGCLAVPGLIEPHAHAELIYGPLALAAAAGEHGTTTLCCDMLTFTAVLDDDELLRLQQGCEAAPVRMLWALRASAEGGGDVAQRLSAARLIALMERLPSIISVGEMTAWRDLVDGDSRLGAIVRAARCRRMRVNGHAPGASQRSLQRIAVSGVSDDHEATTAAEAMLRLDNGFWVMVRHSSLRPDARRILAGLLDSERPLTRVMLTTDGPVAADLVNGHLDLVVREAIAAGIGTIDAIRMATINPATYLGLDGYIGSLSPGRYADIAIVSDLENFSVESVLVGGRPPASAPNYPPGLQGRELVEADLTASQLSELLDRAPAARLDGLLTRALGSRGAGDAIAALVARDGSWIVVMSVANLELDALASSYSGSGDILLIGRDLDLVAECYHRMMRSGPGIATPRRFLPLPLLGSLSLLPVSDLAAIIDELSADIHLRAGDIPFEFLLLFLGLGVLPDRRLTPGGVLDVKSGKILAAPTRLAPDR